MEPKQVTAKLKLHRQSPRKVRLVADMIRGKKVEEAVTQLDFLRKRSSLPLKKLVQSALANAKSLNIDPSQLFVKTVFVDAGPILYRRRFRARGQVFPIRKRTSHISLVLEEKPTKTIDKKPETEEKKTKLQNVN